jgi:hypothetical protein
MRFSMRHYLHIMSVCALCATILIPQTLLAQDHLVTPADLQKQAVAASQGRQHDLATVQQFLSSPSADRALRSAHMNPAQVKNAVAGLGDQELQQLAARTQKAQADFAAGTLSDRDLIIILLAIAALVLIIVAVR